jgi:signal transduction histidine kinase
MTVPGRPPLRPVLVPDLWLAALVAVVMVIGSGVSLNDDFRILVSGAGGSWLPGVDGLLLMLLGSLPLGLRRLAPLTVLAVVSAASLAYQALGYRPEPLPLGVLVALYTVAALRSPLVGGGAAAIYMTALTGSALIGWTDIDDDQYFVDLVAVVATVTLAYGLALNRARATLAEQRTAELTRDQDARTNAAVAQEQARIAREMHDLVAHDVSVMVAQAAAARRVVDSQPQTAAGALASVETLGREALDGLRRMLDLLRARAEEEDTRSPQPGLERLPALVEQVRRAGLPVEYSVTGTSRPLPATVELNAFRIVQEALTNSLKHGRGAGTSVTLDYSPTELRIDVLDRGRGPARGPQGAESGGYGLISMRQRAALLGGVLEVGPHDGSGFRVSARLPLAEGPEPGSPAEPAGGTDAGSTDVRSDGAEEAVAGSPVTGSPV